MAAPQQPHHRGRLASREDALRTQTPEEIDTYLRYQQELPVGDATANRGEHVSDLVSGDVGAKLLQEDDQQQLARKAIRVLDLKGTTLV